MFYSGFIFIDFRVKDLNPYSHEELEIYKNKILLAYLTFYCDSITTSNGYRLHSSENKISNKDVPDLLMKHYNLKLKDIADYTPINRKILNKNKLHNISVYVVVLNPKKLKTFKKNTSVNHTFMKAQNILFYDLKTVSNNLDVAQSIINYDKLNNLNYKEAKTIHINESSTMVLSISNLTILNSLKGALTFDTNTKRYILN